jgi:hypothetical protein
MLDTSDLAKRFGITAVALRRMLRCMPEYADGTHTRYEWHENDPMIDKISTVVEQRKTKEPIRAEDKAADRLAKYLRQYLPNKYDVRTRSCLLYKIAIDGSGNLVPRNPQKYLAPSRGQSAFEIDILITKKATSVPVVAIEVKLGKFSTHDVLTYSTKAIKHKDVFPYLRYGFVIADCNRINNKFFTHNVGFDFALAFPERPEGRGELVSLVQTQIEIAERLMALSDEEHKNKIYKFEILVKTS